MSRTSVNIYGQHICKANRGFGGLVLLSLAIFALTFPAQAQKYCDGTGTTEDPYLICAPFHMQQIGANPDDWDKHFKLTADIDLSAYTATQFNIIGRYVEYDDPCNLPFTGTFDGNGHTISNFTHTSAGADYVGLFGYVAGQTVQIRDLGLISPDIDAPTGTRVAALAGHIDGSTISDCYVEGGTVTGHSIVGPLAGWAINATILRCFATCDVTGDDWGTGGLIGNASDTTISACYATGSVTADQWGTGGLVGHQYRGQILTSYATGPVTGNNYGVGGLLGNGRELFIAYCYAAGSVIGVDDVGGLVGYLHTGDILASFWDKLTTGQPDGIGYNEENDPVEVYPRTTTQLQTESTFTSAGWDFVGETTNGTEDIWAMLEGIDYPEFVWQGPLAVSLDIDSAWMYQNVFTSKNSKLTAIVSIADDPLENTGYTYDWEFILPDDVTVAPAIAAGGGPADPCCKFAAPSCNEPGGLSDSGQPLTVRVTVTGADFGNIATAEAQFGIALLADANNDGVVNIADRNIINAFWRLGKAGSFTFNDCNVNGDTAVNLADRNIANAVWRSVLGRNRVSQPCPLR